MKTVSKLVKFKKLEPDEIVPPGAYHSLDDGETLFPLFNPNSVGQKVSEFSSARSFWVFFCIDEAE